MPVICLSLLQAMRLQKNEVLGRLLGAKFIGKERGER